MFCHEQFHNCDVKNIIDISQQFKLIRINDLHGHFDETMSLATAHVQNDEEMLLTQRCVHTNSSISCLSTNRSPWHDGQQLRYPDNCDSDESSESLAGPTQEHIELATADVDAKHFAIPAIVNIDELVLQSDVSAPSMVNGHPASTHTKYMILFISCSHLISDAIWYSKNCNLISQCMRICDRSRTVCVPNYFYAKTKTDTQKAFRKWYTTMSSRYGIRCLPSPPCPTY